MQPLNAIDAISPAFTRTHETLGYPFRLGRAWKLCASNYLAVMGSVFIPYPLLFLLGVKMLPAAAFPQFIVLGMALFYTVILLLLLYFGGKMELVVFEMVVTRGKFIAPMWRRYKTRVWPWLGWKVLIGTVCAFVVCAAAYVPIKHAMSNLMPMMMAAGVGTPPDPAAMQSLVVRMIGIESVIFALFFLLKIPSTLFNDFVLPFFVLEDIPLTAAMRRGFEVFLADPLQVILYLIMKPILFVVGGIMMEIALMICMIPVVIVGIILAFVGAAVLGHNNPAAVVVMAIGLGGLYGVVLWAAFGAGGYLIMLLEAYGIYFLGGRYPLLGNLLEPGPGAPFATPPVCPSSEERKDKDGGPPMPMNPAVA